MRIPASALHFDLLMRMTTTRLDKRRPLVRMKEGGHHGLFLSDSCLIPIMGHLYSNIGRAKYLIQCNCQLKLILRRSFMLFVVVVDPLHHERCS